MPILSKRAKVKAAAASTHSGGQTLYIYGSNYSNLNACSIGVGNSYLMGGVCRKDSYSNYYYYFPASCPSGWTEGGLGPQGSITVGSGTIVRSCYKCS